MHATIRSNPQKPHQHPPDSKTFSLWSKPSKTPPKPPDVPPPPVILAPPPEARAPLIEAKTGQGDEGLGKIVALLIEERAD
eukprot:1179422-Amorphochlora_amoeboformis.AAC.1